MYIFYVNICKNIWLNSLWEFDYKTVRKSWSKTVTMRKCTSQCRSHVLQIVVPVHMYLLKHYSDVDQQRLGDLGRAPFNKGKTFFNIEG